MRGGDGLRIALVSLGVVASIASAAGGPDLDSPIAATAPRHGDIVTPELINRFLYEEARQNRSSGAELARAARSVEIVLESPLVLSTFNPFLIDDDITVTDSRFPGQQRPILDYLDQGLPGTPNAAFSFRRAAFARPKGEGNCESGSSDRTCDSIVLHLSEGAVTDGTTIQFNLSGEGLDGYVVIDGAPTADTFTFAGQSSFSFHVATETGDPPELQSYSLRLPGDSGPDIEGEFEIGVCTTCPPPSTKFSLPQYEFYLPPRAGVRGIFNESPARLGVFAEIGNDAFYVTSDLFETPDGQPFVPGVDREFQLDDAAALVTEIGTKIDTLAITSDDLQVQLGTPGRFLLPPATQSASGRGFVQTLGTPDGQMPSSDIQHFTVSHLRLPIALPEHSFVGLADLQGDTQVELQLDVVVDPDNPKRTVTELEVLIRDGADPTAPRQLLQSTDEFLDPAAPTVTFDMLDIPEGEWVFYVRGRNSSGGNLGSDRVRMTVDFTVPLLLTGSSWLIDPDLTDGILDQVCVGADEQLSALEISIDPPGTTLVESLDGVIPTQIDGILIYCLDDVQLPPGVGTDGTPYSVTIAPIDKVGNRGLATLVVAVPDPYDPVLAEQLDWVPPGTLPAPANHEGPALTPTPPSSGYVTKRAEFDSQLAALMPVWEAQGLTVDEISQLRADLKRTILTGE